jgi:hypothetical protein
VVVPSFIIDLDSRGYVETGEDATPFAEEPGLSVRVRRFAVPRHRRGESVEVLVRPDVVVPHAEEIEVFLQIEASRALREPDAEALFEGTEEPLDPSARPLEAWSEDSRPRFVH